MPSAEYGVLPRGSRLAPHPGQGVSHVPAMAGRDHDVMHTPVRRSPGGTVALGCDCNSAECNCASRKNIWFASGARRQVGTGRHSRPDRSRARSAATRAAARPRRPAVRVTQPGQLVLSSGPRRPRRRHDFRWCAVDPWTAVGLHDTHVSLLTSDRMHQTNLTLNNL